MQLFNNKTINRHVLRAAAPDAAKLETLRQWGETIRDRSIETQKETALHGNFKQRIICEVLGYQDFNDSGNWTVDVEAQIGAGSVDLALGHFNKGERRIIAPFELKGAKTRNLDAIMPGRAKTPVQQAWEYASDNVGTKWVLVSNYLEIRLYSYAEGRQFHETFDLAKLHDPAEYQRFMLLLSADNLLTGQTLALLDESRKEDRDITSRLYKDYRALRSDLIGAVQSALPDGDPLESIRLGQTILDRVLFIAFAEDNGLLPDNSLLNAFEHNDPYHPKPVWQTFLGLFNAIDRGNDQLKIPRYNGGLFHPNAVIDALLVPDHICAGFKRLAEYDFASEISVTVLGHIFEQSIADVEQLQAEARGEAPVEKKATGTSGRRKRDGVVYTPDYVARFIVDQTLGAHCKEIFAGILGQYAAKGAKADDDPIAWKSGKAEKQAWAEYRDRLTALRIVDPACGSGVFLIMAFDYLKAELQQVNTKLAELEGKGMAGSLLDPDSEILTHNLFGVDVNSESVEIAKLSLWIKTARRGKVLDSLDANLRVGDSLIEDSSYAYRSTGFEWKTAFPDIFAAGGFDVVLGNPPYVRMELIKPMKPWLEKRYEVVSDRADLYAYFFERGIKLLKPGGRLGYISSSTFFKTGSGAPLRDFLRNKATLETVVDFGDHQIFEGVTTYPAILTMKAGGPPQGHDLQFWKIGEMPTDSFADAFTDAAKPFPQEALERGSWELEGDALRALRAKIIADKPTLKDVYGSPLYGIKTGLNEAFVIDTPTKEKLCRDDPRSAELLKPFLEGKDLKRWRAEPRGLWIIYIPKNRIRIDDYPAIRDWLLPYKTNLEKRATKQEWFELQQAQEAFAPAMDGKKIGYIDMAMSPSFSLQNKSEYYANTAYFIPTDDTFLLAVLNTPIGWFVWGGFAAIARGGVRRLFTQHIEKTPIPAANNERTVEIGTLATSAQAAAEKRYTLQQSIVRRIPDLAADPASAKLTTKLKEWWNLPDFAAFQKEVEKALKGRIPLKERNEWENWISTTRAEIHALTAEIARLEAEINAKVYDLFNLTPDEIALLEANV
ncbi:Eco57I restriction-modification methylase domain-containing protein [Novosphingobium sp. MMS21-SN21R]|uniref:Eco57I restriction-modification methylase domain-containing protein n=1 Tax=Novosphingobium sp. MMS21-SN21R TaxID=2969298 RepID=UPI0028838B8A|nr:DNA methyltransferase [Novosphingobium sp. MMS21-SN21R]MDT0508849.1 DNA methyltransferase [Novosphingobium sp. MMS21-SN21R]